jgi:uncharacterized membrane protein YeaQ/YmgE (transglycosylase-associated protein family)
MGWTVFIVWCVIATAVATWIGFSVKGRPLTGFLLGILLGWIGVLVTALLPPTAEKRVQRRLRDDAISFEAQRRQMGHQPWTGELPAQRTWDTDVTQQFPAQAYPPPYPQQAGRPAPVRPKLGDEWTDPVSGRPYLWNGSSWIRRPQSVMNPPTQV